MDILARVFLIFSIIMLSSCISVLPSPEQRQMNSPIEVSQIKVFVEETSNVGLTESKFFDEGVFKKSDNASALHLTYQECAAIFDEGGLKRSLNIILPAITLGFVPHKMKYICPLVIESTRDQKVIGKYRYDILVETSASIYELFKSKPSVELQLNNERFRATKKIIQENSMQIVGQK